MVMANERTNMEHKIHNFLVGKPENHVLMKLMYAQELAHRGRPIKIPSNQEVTRYCMYYIREHIMPTLKQKLRRGTPKEYVTKNILTAYNNIRGDKERRHYDPTATVAQICLDFTESLVSPNMKNYLNATKSAAIKRIKLLSLEPLEYKSLMKEIHFARAIGESADFGEAIMAAVKQSETLYRSLTKLYITFHLHYYGKKMENDGDGFYMVDTPWVRPEGNKFSIKGIESGIEAMLMDMLFVDIASFLERNGVIVDGYFGDDPKEMLKEVKMGESVLKAYIIMAHNSLLEYSIALMDDHIEDLIRVFVDDEFDGFNEEMMDK